MLYVCLCPLVVCVHSAASIVRRFGEKGICMSHVMHFQSQFFLSIWKLSEILIKNPNEPHIIANFHHVVYCVCTCPGIPRFFEETKGKGSAFFFFLKSKAPDPHEVTNIKNYPLIKVGTFPVRTVFYIKKE